jgi:hypothetical protein
VDALLPLLAAGDFAPEAVCEAHWHHWHPGDVPAKLIAGLRDELPLENGKSPVLCNGIFQGLLQLGQERG